MEIVISIQDKEVIKMKEIINIREIFESGGKNAVLDKLRELGIDEELHASILKCIDMGFRILVPIKRKAVMLYVDKAVRIELLEDRHYFLLIMLAGLYPTSIHEYYDGVNTALIDFGNLSEVLAKYYIHLDYGELLDILGYLNKNIL